MCDMTILDGRAIAAKIRAEVKQEIKTLGISPGLAVILVGNDPASHLYVSLKEKACVEAGIRFEKYLFPENAEEKNIIEKIHDLNARADIHAMLIQLPLPAQIDEDKMIAAMDPKKDVDGFHTENIKLLLAGAPRVIPVVHRGILALIESTNESLSGKSAIIFANSHIFADPLAKLLTDRGAKVEIQINPTSYVLRPTSSLIVSALGRPHWLKCDALSPLPAGDGQGEGKIVVDVGTSRAADGRLVGDVDPIGCEKKQGWITPVPGGVGPMTVAMLLRNVVELEQT